MNTSLEINFTILYIVYDDDAISMQNDQQPSGIWLFLIHQFLSFSDDDVPIQLMMIMTTVLHKNEQRLETVERSFLVCAKTQKSCGCSNHPWLAKDVVFVGVEARPTHIRDI